MRGACPYIWQVNYAPNKAKTRDQMEGRSDDNGKVDLEGVPGMDDNAEEDFAVRAEQHAACGMQHAACGASTARHARLARCNIRCSHGTASRRISLFSAASSSPYSKVFFSFAYVIVCTCAYVLDRDPQLQTVIPFGFANILLLCFVGFWHHCVIGY